MGDRTNKVGGKETRLIHLIGDGEGTIVEKGRQRTSTAKKAEKDLGRRMPKTIFYPRQNRNPLRFIGIDGGGEGEIPSCMRISAD